MQLQGRPCWEAWLRLCLRKNDEARIAPCLAHSVPAKASGVAGARSGGATTTTRCFAAFSPGDACFLAGELVRRPLLVGGTSPFGGDRTLRLGIHCRESAGSFAAHAAAGIHTAVVAIASDRAVPSVQRVVVSQTNSRSVVTSAPLVHSVPWVGCLVCHYPSPAAILRV